MIKFGVLITAHNRREQTLQTIRTILESDGLTANFSIYVNDDGSKDGTLNAIEQKFPEVKTCTGSGYDFWAKGMRRVFNTYSEELLELDYIILANDDISLIRDWDQRLNDFISSKKASDFGVAVGLFLNDSGEMAYGIHSITVSWFKSTFSKVLSPDEVHCCSENAKLVMNANFAVVPINVVRKVGFLDAHYWHGLADFDYSLVVQKHGFRITYLPFEIGTCNTNSRMGTYHDRKSDFSKRLRELRSPKYPTLQALSHFYIKNFGKMPITTAFSELMKMMLPSAWLFAYDALQHFKRSRR